MEPIPQTVVTANELSKYEPETDVLGRLQSMADRVQAIVPDCVGLSLAWTEEGVAFTLVASTEELAVLDGIQYLHGGPCVDAVSLGHGVEASTHDLFSEERWFLFAQASAAAGVRSTITMPLVHDGHVTGSANVYGASDHAFEGHHEAIAAVLGGSAAAVVRNADLSFRTRRAAEDAPAALRARNTIDNAVGVLVAALGLTPEDAERRLVQAAARAGLSVEQLARGLARLF